MICHTKCYHAGRVWEPGESWDDFGKNSPDAKPNSHFSVDGTVPVSAAGRTVRGPGDDPRSTAKMRDQVIEYIKAGVWPGKEPAKNASRKELFAILIEIEGREMGKKAIAASIGTGTTVGTAVENSGPNAGRSFENPLMNKLFSDMTPDDINNLKASELRDKLQMPPYSIELGSGVVAKADLVKRGIAIEEQIGRSKAGI
jgi:hypothetical protein